METLRTYKNFELLTDGIYYTIYNCILDCFQDFDTLEEANDRMDAIEYWDEWEHLK